MRAVRLGLIVVSVALMAACGSSNGSQPNKPALSGASASAAPVVKATGPTASGNELAAQAEAAKLVAQAALPPGAVASKTQPPRLSGPIMGTPGVSHLVDTVRYYRVPMSIAQARAWFQKNPQSGFIQRGSENGTDAGVPNFGWEYEVPAHLTWGTASLDIGVSPEGPTATGIRLDGLTEWIDPTPVRDTFAGRGTRVTFASGCPLSDQDVYDVSNPDAPDLDHVLLPAAPPRAALICRYGTVTGKPFALAGTQRLNAMQAAARASQIRSLPLGSLGLGAHSCPSTNDGVTIFVFSYAGRADVDIRQTTSECGTSVNGHIAAGYF